MAGLLASSHTGHVGGPHSHPASGSGGGEASCVVPPPPGQSACPPGSREARVSHLSHSPAPSALHVLLHTALDAVGNGMFAIGLLLEEKTMRAEDYPRPKERKPLFTVSPCGQGPRARPHVPLIGPHGSSLRADSPSVPGHHLISDREVSQERALQRPQASPARASNAALESDPNAPGQARPNVLGAVAGAASAAGSTVTREERVSMLRGRASDTRPPGPETGPTGRRVSRCGAREEGAFSQNGGQWVWPYPASPSEYCPARQERIASCLR